jgi:hypothetical protein
VDVVYITVAIIVGTRLTVCFSFVGPKLIAQILVVNEGAIVEDSDYDRFDRPVVMPGE